MANHSNTAQGKRGKQGKEQNLHSRPTLEDGSCSCVRSLASLAFSWPRWYLQAKHVERTSEAGSVCSVRLGSISPQ